VGSSEPLSITLEAVVQGGPQDVCLTLEQSGEPACADAGNYGKHERGLVHFSALLGRGIGLITDG